MRLESIKFILPTVAGQEETSPNGRGLPPLSLWTDSVQGGMVILL